MSNSSNEPNTKKQKISPEETMSLIKASVDRLLASMVDGGSCKLDEFVRKVVDDTGLRTSAVNVFAPAYVNSSGCAYVQRGRNGGVVKGEKKGQPDRPRCPTCGQYERKVKNVEELNALTVPQPTPLPSNRDSSYSEITELESLFDDAESDDADDSSDEDFGA